MPNPDRPAALFLDLDGTLTDPALGIVRCIEHALGALNQPVPEREQLLHWIGPPLRDSFATLLGAQWADQAVALYRERFANVGLYENELYTGVGAALDALCRGGRTLYVVTSKPRVFAERIVEHFGIEGYFASVYGSELDGTRADKAQLIAHALRDARLLPRAVKMIGDRKHDVLGAKANGLDCAGVLWGYGSRQELLLAGADRLYADFDELVADLA